MSRSTAKLRSLLRPHAGWYVLLAAAGLTVMGIAAIATVDVPHAQDQARWWAISLLILAICMLPKPRQIGLVSIPLAIAITVLLLVIVLPVMPRSIVPVRNGTRAWINLRIMMFQPSEAAKIIFVLALAWYLRHRDSYRTLRGLLAPFAIMFLPMALVMLEPDLGTAVLFLPVLCAMLVAAGAKLRHLGAIVALTVLAVVLNIVAIYTLPDSMQLLRAHQRARIKATISQAKGETRYLDDVGFQQDKSLTLAGAGGLRGVGGERAATLIHFNRLPEDHNDMIYTVIANRWGWVGGATVLGLFGLMIGSMLVVAARTKSPFSRLAVVGFAALLFTQMTINVGMAIGLLPIIGITLPLVSYGGSSLAATYALVGLVMNFAVEKPPIISRPSFEYEHVERIFQ